jgi:large subunit ribosomal protein L17
MRHRKAGIKIGRTSSHRDAMFRNMVTSLLKYDKIKTTDVKAKEVSRWADRIITLAKRGDLHARRQAMAIVREKDVVHRLFENVSQRFGEINGGYTRIIKIGRRPGDAAPVSIIELVVKSDVDSKSKKGKASSKTKEAKVDLKKESGVTQTQPAGANEMESGGPKSTETVKPSALPESNA